MIQMVFEQAAKWTIVITHLICRRLPFESHPKIHNIWSDVVVIVDVHSWHGCCFNIFLTIQLITVDTN